MVDSLREKEDGGDVISPIKKENLRQHFKKTYRLADEQVDVMLESSARSLRTTFSAAEDTLLKSRSYSDIARHAHSMKGLLLNMGEEKWAARARAIEVAALGEEDIDYYQKMREIRRGVIEII